MKGKISPELRTMLNQARVPRSFPALLARATAPSTDQTPNVDAVLLATMADAVRQLQAKHDALDTEVRRLRNKVLFLEGAFEP